jgi:dephospho-CoA kinase
VTAADSSARRLLRVALTGGIATGKSYCLARFAAAGVPTIDADALAREAVAPGSMGLAAVSARFGAAVLRADGRLDRAALGRLVFADADARRDLEAIIHPRVYDAIGSWFSRTDASRPAPPLAVADVPLLYETNRAADFDCVVVAACEPGQQLTRLMARDRLSEAEARARIDSQLSIPEKVRRADYVVDTSGTMAETDARIDDVLARLRTRAVGAADRRP